LRQILNVRRKTVKITVLSILWSLGLVVLCAAAFYWRLSQGPISLAFMGSSIEDAINRQLPGFKVSLGESELELDKDTRRPNVRVRNLVLSAPDGAIIASVPKAGVALSKADLLQGRVSIESLDLIGPRINARRNLDGSMELGIDNDAAAAEQDTIFEDAAMAETQTNDGSTKKSESETAKPAAPLISGSTILALLDAGGENGSLAKLGEVRVSRADLRLYDEANDATWRAPSADLAFRRVPSGFVIATKANVASGGEPWQLEASVTYRKAEKNFTANVAIDNLVPANVADEIFALSQFARLTTPLSGHFEIEADEGGDIAKVEGQVFAAAGQVNLPEYLANPIIIDEGTLRIRHAGKGKPIELVESSILMGSSRADLKGELMPERAEDGRITSYKINLSADNVSVDAQGTVKDPVFVDRVEFKGRASVEEQRVDIDDMVVMAASTGVRLRGVISAGEASPGIQVAGRLRDVSSALLKKLWPPVLAPRTRTWINENIESGLVSEGVFQVNFPPNVLAKAQREKQLPKGSVEMSFSMRDVTTHYFKDLPVLKGANGSASLKDDEFNLEIRQGTATLQSGNALRLEKGTFNAVDLLEEAVPGTFNFDIRGSVPALLEYAALPDLNLATVDTAALPKLEGQARAEIGLKLPLIKNVPRSSVQVTTKVSLADAAVADVLPGIDLTDGQFAIDLGKDQLAVTGPAKLNGVSAKIAWKKPRAGGKPLINIETTMTEKLRDKLGIKLNDVLSGDIPVTLELSTTTGNTKLIKVEADLADVNMRVAAAGWSRQPTPGTSATFDFVDEGQNGKRIEGLKIDGKGLRVRGDVQLNANNGLKVVQLDEIRLNDDDVFSARIQPGEDATKLQISGNTFDARPYIKNLISPSKAGASGGGLSKGGANYIVEANFKSVTAHRGETVRNVAASFVARSGTIMSATVDGNFESGQPLNVKVTGTPGGREMRVNSTDGGATLRAANFYSKVAGGQLEFYALIANAPGSPIRNGNLTIKRFSVRNEAALAELDSRGRPKKSGPRIDGVSFKRLKLPFTTDAKFVRLCNVELKGNDLGGVAKGLIRKADGAIDITGTMIPAQGINGFLDDVPLLGQILTGGKGEGLFGITFAMGGNISNPKTQVNPLSALAPGFLRKAFEFRGTCGVRGSNAESVTTGDPSNLPY
jgi:Protein of unknown function/AsmA-like C-terminal region